MYRIDLVERSLAETIETGLDRQPVPFLKDRDRRAALTPEARVLTLA